VQSLKRLERYLHEQNDYFFDYGVEWLNPVSNGLLHFDVLLKPTGGRLLPARQAIAATVTASPSSSSSPVASTSSAAAATTASSSVSASSFASAVGKRTTSPSTSDALTQPLVGSSYQQTSTTSVAS